MSSEIIEYPSDRLLSEVLEKYNGNIILYFGTGWCKNCAPYKAKVLNELHKIIPNVQIIHANGDELNELCDELNIEGFPTTIVYSHGKSKLRFEGYDTKQPLKTITSIVKCYAS